ncbi:lipase family protein [Streptomyces justiciae]|uniref:Lipase family protein n=1 Tax=Streptomyces justiciae TaxID=2780140 RepID=A0ABU3LRJ4_9ACTN|nr:lipase family protein [Streptomyces justiciae]MDT7841436.1 lipase family protein [Streptomyces justiciae]
MKRKRKPLFLGVAAVLLGGALAVPAVTAEAGTPEACTAADVDIYRPPDRPSAPGTVIACRAVGSLPMVGSGTSMKAWKVQYGSTDAHGKSITVAGTVVVPEEAWTGPGERPLVSFAPGTLGIGPQCAFSKQLAGEYVDAYEGPNIAALLKAGYAVAATDGVGYLDGQVHPYVSGLDAGHAVLDMARVASKVPGSGVSPTAQVGLWGYSEGGSGSLWAAQLAASYAPELKMAGVASGGVPGDLKQVGAQLNGGGFAGFLVDAVIGLSVTHPEMPFDELLNDQGRKAIAKAKSLCAVGTVAQFVGARIENYTTDHLSLAGIYALRGPDGTTWGELVDGNKLGVGIGPSGSGARYEIGFPVLQYRGLLDEVIPAETGYGTRRAYCDAGVETRWKSYAGDHLLGDPQAINDVVEWLGERFAGRAMTSNCQAL